MLLARKNDGLSSMSRFFDEFFGRNWLDWPSRHSAGADSTLPSVNVKETDEAYSVEMAVPGMAKEDFKVKVQNGQLIISSEQKTEKSDEKDGYTRKEYSYSSFCRTFALPDNADPERIKARYDKGILTVELPKNASLAADNAQVIEIE